MSTNLFRVGPLFNATAIATTGSATSEVIDLQHIDRIESLEVLLASSGTADVKIEYAISHDGANFGTFDDYTDIVASSNTEFVTKKGLTAVPMPAPLARYVKFKVTGTASNDASTTITMYLTCREMVTAVK